MFVSICKRHTEPQKHKKQFERVFCNLYKRRTSLLSVNNISIGIMYKMKIVTSIFCYCIVLLIVDLNMSVLQSHTILLVQPGTRPETRTYSDYESVNDCMEGVCKIYEEHLKRKNPNTPTITYDISQLFDFVDQVCIHCAFAVRTDVTPCVFCFQLADLSCLVYQKSTNTYAPYNKDWIKEKIYVLLRQAAGQTD